MSTNTRLQYDVCAYKQKQNVSAGIGKYQMEGPRPYCNGCTPTDSVRVTRLGGSSCINISQIEIDSELRLIQKPASKCTSDAMLAKCDSYVFTDCQTLPTENTRLQNPPSTLRCNGINRFEHLCQDPQKVKFITRDLNTYNVSSRIIVKDNHRPLSVTLMNQSPILPPQNADDSMYNGIAACVMHC